MFFIGRCRDGKTARGFPSSFFIPIHKNKKIASFADAIPAISFYLINVAAFHCAVAADVAAASVAAALAVDAAALAVDFVAVASAVDAASFAADVVGCVVGRAVAAFAALCFVQAAPGDLQVKGCRWYAMGHQYVSAG